MTQVFAYTAPTNPNGPTAFVQVFRRDDGRHELHVRGEDGRVGKIVLEDTKRLALGVALMGDFLIVSGKPVAIDPSFAPHSPGTETP